MPLPRKRRIRAPRKWAQDIGDLHDYVQGPSQRACVGKAEMQIAVSDDWPDLVPISDAELRVIEGHLRSELDKLFGPLPWCKEYKAMTSAARQPHQDEAPVATTARAALYLRVSTSKQAESDLSIPDQRRQIENYCL